MKVSKHMSTKKLPYIKYSIIFIGINLALLIALTAFEIISGITPPTAMGAIMTTAAATLASGMFVKKVNRPLEKKENRTLGFFMTFAILILSGVILGLLYTFQVEPFVKSEKNISAGLIAGLTVAFIVVSYLIVALGVRTGTKAAEKKLVDKETIENIAP